MASFFMFAEDLDFCADRRAAEMAGKTSANSNTITTVAAVVAATMISSTRKRVDLVAVLLDSSERLGDGDERGFPVTVDE